MNALELFDRAASLWPAHVEFLPAQKNPSAELWCPGLARINTEVEKKIDFTSDHWTNIAAWAFYQAATRIALDRMAQGQTTLWLKDIPIEVFDEYVRSNLLGSDFGDERVQYTGI
jgi:hypothetical protein